MRYSFLATALVLAGCAGTSSYMGISLRPGAAEPGLQNLAARSAAGDKQAQLELGIRYEEGNGVPINSQFARILYMRSATTTGGKMYIYSPPVGSSKAGRLITVESAPASIGLPEAKKRLDRLRHDKKIKDN